MRSAPRMAAVALFGFGLGFLLSSLGFTDWGEVHTMFTLGFFAGGPSPGTLRLLFAFCGAVMLSLVAFRAFARQDNLPRRTVHKGTVIGGLAFGAGWALTGGCPSIAIVQLGEGRVTAGASVAGVLLGTWVARKAAARLRWQTGSCSD